MDSLYRPMFLLTEYIHTLTWEFMYRSFLIRVTYMYIYVYIYKYNIYVYVHV